MKPRQLSYLDLTIRVNLVNRMNVPECFSDQSYTMVSRIRPCTREPGEPCLRVVPESCYRVG